MSLAKVILATIRDSLDMRVSAMRIEDADALPMWRIEASSSQGESWTVEHEDQYLAAVELARLVGLDLADG